MNKTYRARFVPALLSAAVLLGGCSLQDKIGQLNEEPWEPDATAFQIMEDGTVKETLLEKLDRDYYMGAEVSAMVQSAVADYNAAAGGQRVTAEPVLGNETSVKVVLTYASDEDCAAFNNTVFFSGSMLDAEMSGYLFYQDFAHVEKNGSLKEGISWEEVLSHKEYQAVICDRFHKVQVPGKIVYLSEGATLERADVAVPDLSDGPQDAVSIYLPGVSNDADREREQEKNYLFVIYE